MCSICSARLNVAAERRCRRCEIQTLELCQAAARRRNEVWRLAAVQRGVQQGRALAPQRLCVGAESEQTRRGRRAADLLELG